jgi:hypothetical protein
MTAIEQLFVATLQGAVTSNAINNASTTNPGLGL